MAFGPYGGFHGHFDKLSFVFFGFGQELGVDPGRAKSQAYRLPVHRDWYKATLSHNTVLVDGGSQNPAAGRLEFFAANDEYAVAVARCGEAYPGTTHRRLLCLMPGSLVVFDEMKSAGERRFDWVYHNRGTEVVCDAARKEGKFGEKYPGQEYVARVKVGTTAEPVRATFPGPKVATCLIGNAFAGTEVRTGDGVGEAITDRVPMIMLTRRGRESRFAVVLEPLPKGQPRQTREVVVEQADGETVVTIHRDKGEERLALDADGKVRLQSGGRIVVWRQVAP
jgi:hypothetical protein